MTFFDQLADACRQATISPSHRYVVVYQSETCAVVCFSNPTIDSPSADLVERPVYAVFSRTEPPAFLMDADPLRDPTLAFQPLLAILERKNP